eukprot:TRINITY_DN9505_c0_g1_i2.p1 TRINITY_DN9505_c0_g1~~TRINITY_DN9505_c0_g1_i2.p1  ORF type:complete len:179 (+),score=3.48 TRINITY_DN9505_c0_g1_i2:63-599(+)
MALRAAPPPRASEDDGHGRPPPLWSDEGQASPRHMLGQGTGAHVRGGSDTGGEGRLRRRTGSQRPPPALRTRDSVPARNPSRRTAPTESSDSDESDPSSDSDFFAAVDRDAEIESQDKSWNRCVLITMFFAVFFAPFAALAYYILTDETAPFWRDLGVFMRIFGVKLGEHAPGKGWFR